MSYLKAIWDDRWKIVLSMAIPGFGCQLVAVMWASGDHFMGVVIGLITFALYGHVSEWVRLW